jgi:hypothetical protein
MNMNERQIKANQRMVDKMIHTTVNIKYGKRDTYDPITGTYTTTWDINKEVPAYIGKFELEKIAFSDNKLTTEHSMVIIKGEEEAEFINDKPVDFRTYNKGYTVFGVIL